MESIGNTSLLDRRKIGFLAGSKIAPLSVLPTLDWASEIATHEDVAVVSGFHSQLEHHVLDILLKGRCGIICVLARSIYKKIPALFLDAFTAARILFISPLKSPVLRSSRQLCQKRNEYVAFISDEMVFSSVTPGSSIYPLTKLLKPNMMI